MNDAVKRLSGYYGCVVEFLNSGAKLETPHELINIVGEYHGRACEIMKRPGPDDVHRKNFFVAWQPGGRQRGKKARWQASGEKLAN